MAEKQNNYCLVVRPLSNWPFKIPARLTLRVWVKTNPQFRDTAFLRWALSGREIEDLTKRQHWLSCQFKDSGVAGSNREQRAIKIIQNAALALQIVAPVGSWESQIIALDRRADGLQVRGMVHRPPQYTVPWARGVQFDSRAENELPLVVSGVQKTIARGSVRLKNALNFFELGLDSTNPYLQFFLWTSALDGLLMAANARTFRERLCSLFGHSNFVLPASEFGQPRYRVEDVADDLFELRSKIAHGSEIPKKFWTGVSFEDENGIPISVVQSPRPYYQVLGECSLFLLCRLLRWIFVNDLQDIVGDAIRWRRKIEGPHVSIP
jgi:hypothetical protein